MTCMDRGIVSFGEFELDHDRFELRRSGVAVPTERQVFDLLSYLVAAEGRVVTKEELLDNVWGTRFVTESALTTQIKVARRALGDSGHEQRYIRTVHRRGYEFVGRVVPTDTSGAESARPEALPETSWAPPVVTDDLIGRDRELDELVEAVRRRPLVTLVGPAGVGKTRLARSALRRLAAGFADGVVQVDLATVSDPADLPRSVAEAGRLGLREGVAVADAVAQLEAVLLLDNCEHLLDAVAAFVDRLFAQPGCPARVLATSREPLGLELELTAPLAPLGTAAPDEVADRPSPAARLFLTRAGAEAATVQLPAVEHLVATLDGLPLAIELAAAQLGVMSVEELDARLRDHRVQLTGERRLAARHTSLESSVGWSWELLEDVDRRTLTEISVLPGSWSLDAVEGVLSATDPVASVRRLRSKSLVATSRTTSGTRFQMLYGVRAFVRPFQQQLPGGPAAVRARLVRWLADWLDEWSFEEQWVSSEFLDLLVAEREMIREATKSRDVAGLDDVARIAGAAAASYRYGLGVGTARPLVEELLGSDNEPTVGARLHLAAAEVAYAYGDTEGKDRLAEVAHERAITAGRGDIAAAALLQRSLGRMLTEPVESRERLARATELAARSEAPRIQATALALAGFCELGAGGTAADALRTAGLADELAAPFGWDRVCVQTLRGAARLGDGDRGAAESEFAAISAAARTADLSAAAAVFALIAATCNAGAADPTTVRTLIEDFRREYRRATGRSGDPDALLLLGSRAALLGDPARAAALLRVVRGHPLAHQISTVILQGLARSLAIEPLVGPAEPPPVLAQILEQELASL